MSEPLKTPFTHITIPLRYVTYSHIRTCFIDTVTQPGVTGCCH